MSLQNNFVVRKPVIARKPALCQDTTDDILVDKGFVRMSVF